MNETTTNNNEEQKPIYCYHCGLLIDGEPEMIRISESPKDELGILVPVCGECYNHMVDSNDY